MGQSNALIEIKTTFHSEDEAWSMLDSLLQKRFVACGHILSFRGGYWWEGKIQDGREFLLILKTPAHLRDEVFAHIKENHSYDVPMITSVLIDKVDADYAAWAISETSSS